MRVLSFDIGTAHCVALEGNARKGNVEVHRAVVADLPAENETSGKTPVTTYAMDLAASIMRDARFKTKNAVVTVNINNLIIRNFTLPNAPQKHLNGMVRNEMINTYNAAPADVLQYLKQPAQIITGETADQPESREKGKNGKNGKKGKYKGETGIRAVAVKREIIDIYWSFLRGLKLKPLAMDVHANAIEKLVIDGISINNANMKGKVYMLVDFGSSGTVTHVVADDRVYISRYIPLGVSDLDQLVADRDFSTAQEAKTFRTEKMDFLLDEEPQSAQMKAARTFLYQWSDEVQKVTRFFLSRRGLNAIDFAYVYGAGSDIKGLPEYLSASMGIETSRLDAISRVIFKDKSDQAKIRHCLNAAGAMIRL